MKTDMRLFYHILDLCIKNASILYRKIYKQKHLNANFTILEFRTQVATTLMKLEMTSTPSTSDHPSSSTKITDVILKKKARRTPTPYKDNEKDRLDHRPEPTVEKMGCMSNHCKGFTR